MISVIVGTSHKGRSHLVGQQIYNKILSTAQPVQLVTIADIDPVIFSAPHMYNYGEHHPELLRIHSVVFANPEKHIYVVPEYNGSFPGELKLLIDALSTYQRNAAFNGKKAALVGVGTGRAGNLRGMEDLTGILNYLGTHVWPQKMPISNAGTLMNENGLSDQPTLDALYKLLADFMAF
jgi:hypothetical protein